MNNESPSEVLKLFVPKLKLPQKKFLSSYFSKSYLFYLTAVHAQQFFQVVGFCVNWHLLSIKKNVLWKIEKIKLQKVFFLDRTEMVGTGEGLKDEYLEGIIEEKSNKFGEIVGEGNGAKEGFAVEGGNVKLKGINRKTLLAQEFSSAFVA